jgi:hypothetical protein
METLPFEIQRMIWMRYMRDHVLPFLVHDEVVHDDMGEITDESITRFSIASTYIVSQLLRIVLSDPSIDPGLKRHYFTCEIAIDVRYLCAEAVSLLLRAFSNRDFLTNVRTRTRRSDGRVQCIFVDFVKEMIEWHESMYTTLTFESYTGMNNEMIIRIVCGKHAVLWYTDINYLRTL